mmetsp:Transcript_50912/g.146254  ORF Transcript_50912/g.146254 Transcript_50912/m.146254 type:complete len:225 (+) Transcript_50912:1139-1813(+)
MPQDSISSFSTGSTCTTDTYGGMVPFRLDSLASRRPLYRMTSTRTPWLSASIEFSFASSTTFSSTNTEVRRAIFLKTRSKRAVSSSSSPLSSSSSSSRSTSSSGLFRRMAWFNTAAIACDVRSIFSRGVTTMWFTLRPRSQDSKPMQTTRKQMTIMSSAAEYWRTEVKSKKIAALSSPSHSGRTTRHLYTSCLMTLCLRFGSRPGTEASPGILACLPSTTTLSR